MVKHGEFQAWVKENCACTYETSRQYMQVAKTWVEKTTTGCYLDDLADVSIREFLGRKENPKPSPNATLTTRQVEKVREDEVIPVSGTGI